MAKVDPTKLRAAQRARDVAAAYYLYNPRVTLIDVGWQIKETEDGRTTENLAVRVHVRSKPRGAQLEAFAQRYPEWVIDKERIPFADVDIVTGIYPLQWYPYDAPAGRRGGRFDPLRGGISISNEWSYNYGTLGGLVKDRDTSEDLILSNYHVLAGSAYAREGLRIYQPGTADGGWAADTIARLARHAMGANLDAAVAKLTGARTATSEQLDIGHVAGVTSPRLDMQVVKSGRASDVTEGIIDGVAGEYPIRYGGLLRKIKFVRRIVPVDGNGIVSTGGDSGSWWLEKNTSNAVALHFAGQDDPEVALAIDMPPVLEALNVYIPT